MNAKAPDRLWTAQEVADYLRVSVQQIHTWRYLGRGPRAMKAGRNLRFRQSDVDAWLSEHQDEGAA